MDIQLSVKPYQTLWIDCSINSMLSILMAQRSSSGPYEVVPCLLTARYCRYVEEDISQAESRLSRIPFVHYENQHLELDDLFDTKMMQIHDAEELVNLIQQSLREGYYVYVPLDQYYIPRAFASGKYHDVHPSMIYGYQASDDSFMLLDDALMPGTVQTYALTLEMFRRSLSGSDIRLAKPKEDAALILTRDDIRSIVRHNCEAMLEQGSGILRMGRRSRYGLACLSEFAEDLREVLSEERDPQLAYKALTEPIMYHKRNRLLTQNLLSQQLLSNEAVSQLDERYAELSLEWEKVRYNLGRLLMLGIRSEDSIQATRVLIEGIYHKEQIVTTALFDEVSRSVVT